MLKTSDEKWNEQLENFNLKLKRLKNDVLDYKKSQTHLNKNREIFIPTVKQNIKREFYINTNLKMNSNLNKNKNKYKNMEEVGATYKIQKRRLGRCLLKDSESNNSIKYMKSENSQNGNNGIINQREENKNDKFYFPLSKENSKKTVKTIQQPNVEFIHKSDINYIMRNKRKTEKTDNINNKVSNIVTIKKVNKEPITINNLKDQTILNKKTKKSNLLYLEGEDGNIVVRQIYRDKDVGFHNITKIDDESLSKVKKENQDDDDIKTSKHLAQWSSDLVNKYILETIEKSKLHFLSLNIKSREDEMIQRLRN